MRRFIIISTITAATLVLPTAGPAWAQGHARGGGHFGGGHATIGHAVPRSGGDGHGEGRGYYGGGGYYGGLYPAYGFGLGLDPFWYGYDGPYVDGYGDEAPTGGLRLQVTPKSVAKDAQVYVDGNYVGVVDDFNGHFQHVDLAPGGHHVVVQAAGFEPLAFNTYIEAGHTIDYRGALVPEPASAN